MSHRHALVTGGAGFIGSHLVDVLLSRGYAVTVLDCLKDQVHADADRDADGWPVYLNPEARRIRGDILDDGVFETALPGITHLVHLAASVGVGQSMTNIVDYTRNNVMGAATILEALTKGNHTIERIAVASSMSIYGEGSYLDPEGKPVHVDLRETADLASRRWEPQHTNGPLSPVPTPEDKLLQPASIYAVNKRDHEEMFLSVGRALGIPVAALRLFNAYGSRQALSNPYTGVAAIFISRLLNDQPPLVFEDGRQRRDFVHVGDVADAFATVLDSGKPIWKAYNVGSGRSVTVEDIAHTLARILGKNIAPDILQSYRVGDIRHCFADIAAIEDDFGFRPTREFEAGMTELVEWVRTARKPVDRSAACHAELSRARMVV